MSRKNILILVRIVAQRFSFLLHFLQVDYVRCQLIGRLRERGALVNELCLGRRDFLGQSVLFCFVRRCLRLFLRRLSFRSQLFELGFRLRHLCAKFIHLGLGFTHVARRRFARFRRRGD